MSQKLTIALNTQPTIIHNGIHYHSGIHNNQQSATVPASHFIHNSCTKMINRHNLFGKQNFHDSFMIFSIYLTASTAHRI